MDFKLFLYYLSYTLPLYQFSEICNALCLFLENEYNSLQCNSTVEKGNFNQVMNYQVNLKNLLVQKFNF